MKKRHLVLSCALAGAVACAAPLTVSFEKWDANPIAWTFRDNAVSCKSGGLATYEAAPRAAKVKVSATITPASAGTNGWATLGVALVDDERNYWHLAFVQAPPDDKWNPGGHFFELCEMRDGAWLAQITDKLKQERFEQHGSWSYGQTYAFTLFTDGSGIQGEVRDAADKLIFVRRYAFPAGAINCAPPTGGSRSCATAAVTCGGRVALLRDRRRHVRTPRAPRKRRVLRTLHRARCHERGTAPVRLGGEDLPSV